MSSAGRNWWKSGVVYQVWPASYKDSNGDGVGDFPGIISTLDYLKDLGVDILWISPAYESPQYDMGYDISNYEDIYHKYGTLADAEKLIQGCHDRGMRIIFDLVINHTSNEHAWFKESRASKTNPKRDWYIWRPAKYDEDGNLKPPNNWRAHFGGSAWEWDEDTQEYFLHLFTPQQPDLNWENPVCRDAIWESAVKFWLKRGIDGFRIDTVNMYSKGTELPDAPTRDPTTELQFDPHLFCNGPRMHEFLREMNAKALKDYDVFTVGELPHTPDPAHVLRYISASDKQLDMVFQFDVVDIGQGDVHRFETKPYSVGTFKNALNRLQCLITGTDAWSTAFLENHDQSRSISRFASDKPENRVRSGKLLAMLLITLTGTLYLYQGQEIGMVNVPGSWGPEEFKDVEIINYLEIVRNRTNNDPKALAEALKGVRLIGRDNARTPVHWDDSPHAGFTTGEPWIRVHDLYKEINVKKQQSDPNSVLQFWKRALKLRKDKMDTFVYGDFEMMDGDEKLFTYTKTNGDERTLVCLNFSDDRRPVEAPKDCGEEAEWKLLINNVAPGEKGGEDGWLSAWEGRVWKVSKPKANGYAVDGNATDGMDAAAVNEYMDHKLPNEEVARGGHGMDGNHPGEAAKREVSADGVPVKGAH
ncbi:alpha-glucosidase mal12 [Trapelia coarctata]|nr:alpha-glucosidase mal12 [Trapelia coarctata]